MSLTHYMTATSDPCCGKTLSKAVEDQDRGTSILGDSMQITCPHCLEHPDVKAHWDYVERAIAAQYEKENA